MPSRLIVFDLDGTLVDSRRDLADSMNALLVSCGGAPLPEQLIGRMVGNGAAILVARAFAAASLTPPADALERFMTIYEQHLLDTTRPYDRIPEILQVLGTRAHLAVLTNKPLAATRAILAGLDLARYFADDSVIGGDGPLPRKPDPAGLRQLIARAGATPESTTLVGDSAVDWRTAQNASTRLCVARYGFGFDGLTVDQLRQVDWIAESPDRLINFL